MKFKVGDQVCWKGEPDDIGIVDGVDYEGDYCVVWDRHPDKTYYHSDYLQFTDGYEDFLEKIDERM